MCKFDKNARYRTKFKRYRDEIFYELKLAETKNEVESRVIKNILERHFFVTQKVRLRNKNSPGRQKSFFA